MLTPEHTSSQCTRARHWLPVDPTGLQQTASPSPVLSRQGPCPPTGATPGGATARAAVGAFRLPGLVATNGTGELTPPFSAGMWRPGKWWRFCGSRRRSRQSLPSRCCDDHLTREAHQRKARQEPPLCERSAVAQTAPLLPGAGETPRGG